MKPENSEVRKSGLEEITEKKGGSGNQRYLILHNDDVHSFDYVIESLVEVCKMDSTQAEQCTYLVHYKGKCDIKKGSYEVLKPFREGLVERELKATID
jgi:ATP-dependent Clp protease adaptor protein ClpS